MRLLEYNNDGEFGLAEFFGDAIPRYAILSHRWGAEEVTFKDLMNSTGKSKAGYGKIQFCGEQARRDDLQYFWVDTCCIDKSNSTELAEAINSMFRWYRDATRCYVYLSDVSRLPFDSADESNEPWESVFRKSRWFTRGWTLQELIAPASVEFFSKEGELLGNKASLERHICEITGIPVKALRGGSLPDFSVTERMSWAASRETTCKEDMAYSLLGIFDVNMPLIYGEGREKALKRLKEEIEKASKGIKREDFSVAFSLSNVPEIEYFVAREEELGEMHTNLSSDGSRRTVVLHGLGGIGKTQLSVAYAKRQKDSYSAIFWLNIKDKDSLKQSFAKIARQILREHPSASRLSNMDTNENLDEVVDAVKAWLSLADNTRWLMIYDNYDNPKLPRNTDPAAVDIQKFLPESYQGSIIITTRSSEVRIGHPIQIRKLGDVRDSLEILSNASKREGLRSGKDAPNICTAALNSIIDPDAIKLAKELDGLPLALATAGAYLYQVAMSLLDYLRLYKESWAQLQESSPEHAARCSSIVLNGLVIDDGMEWAYHNLGDLYADQGKLVEGEQMYQRALQGFEKAWGPEHTSTLDTVNNLGILYKNQGKLAEAEQMYQRGLSGYEKALGADHTSTLPTVNNLGNLYYSQGKLVEAEQMYQRALQGYEKAWGPEHTSTLDTVNNLGILYADQGRLVEAEQMYQRALQGFEKAWGPEHTTTLDTVNNLGLLYADQGRLVEAEQMYQRALQGKEKAWGPEHTTTLNTVNNLGNLYANQGKLAKAEQIYQRALQGYEKAWGPEHTSTLNTVNNLGLLYAYQGRLAKAEQMYQRALQGFEKAWGPEHTSTLNTVNNMGNLYKNQGKLAKAEQMYQRALQGFEKAWGPEHTSTLNTVNNMGNLYQNQGKLVEAEQMYQRALQGYEKAVGIENITTYPAALNTIKDLGSVFERHGDIAKARTMYSKAFIGNKIIFGRDHPRSLSLRDKVDTLDVVIKNTALIGAEEPVSKESRQN
ncbi:related to calcium-independent phospholipase A2 [Phialocephala subalpina]|uniref:Related to calcium-independent phospholipase A2 n=1 Tax=Phialocephala subalpina TaxID=576137 RepID=A0A1L7WJH6_9HELO|nr:related to calcium-independent phospholipase A2 [Phialocephala subalpina]